jgi:hypothetical protein
MHAPIALERPVNRDGVVSPGANDTLGACRCATAPTGGACTFAERDADAADGETGSGGGIAITVVVVGIVVVPIVDAEAGAAAADASDVARVTARTGARVCEHDACIHRGPTASTAAAAIAKAAIGIKGGSGYVRGEGEWKGCEERRPRVAAGEMECAADELDDGDDHSDADARVRNKLLLVVDALGRMPGRVLTFHASLCACRPEQWVSAAESGGACLR